MDAPVYRRAGGLWARMGICRRLPARPTERRGAVLRPNRCGFLPETLGRHGMTDWHGLHALLCPGTRRGKPCRQPIYWTPDRECAIILEGPAEATGRARVCHCRRCNAWVEIRRA